MIKHVPAKQALVFQGTGAARLVTLSGILLAIPGSDTESVRIGRVTCGRLGNVMWRRGEVSLTDGRLAKAVTAEFTAARYAARYSHRGAMPLGGLDLVARIENLKVNICPTRGSRSGRVEGYVSVRWELKEPRDGRVLFDGVSRGSTQRNVVGRNAMPEAVAKALGVAARNLLADETFVSFLASPAPEAVLAEAVTFDAAIPVALRYGRGRAFQDDAERLQRTSVTVRAGQGHGSGVIG